MAAIKESKRSQEYSKLFTTLVRDLSTEDVKNIIQALEIDNNDNSILSSLDLMLHLTSKSKISKDNVDYLLAALLECNLTTSASSVKSYIKSAKLLTTFQTSEENNEIINRHSCERHGREIQLFCTTCSKELCIQCASIEHLSKDHDVIAIGDIEQARSVMQKELEYCTSLLAKEVANANQLFSSLMQSIPEVNEIEKKVASTFTTWEKQIYDHKNKVERIVDKEIQMKKNELEILKKKIDIYHKSFSEIKSSHEHFSLDGTGSTSKLHQLFNWKKSVKKLREEMLLEIKKYENIYVTHPLFPHISQDGRFVDCQHGFVIGALPVMEGVFAIVNDERNFQKGLALYSKCEEEQKIRWSYNEKDDLGKFPLIMSNTLFQTSDGNSVILIACGVLILMLMIDVKSEGFSVTRCTKKCFENHRPSFLTAMSTFKRDRENTGALYTVSNSTSVFRANQNLESVVYFECNGFVMSISSIAAASDNKIAVVDTARNKVIVLEKEDGCVNQSCKLQAPNSFGGTMRPKCALWVNKFWSVIWLGMTGSKGIGNTWLHAIHAENGEAIAVTKEGKYNSDKDVVSLSFFNDECVLCLSDGNVHNFKIVSEESVLEMLSSLLDPLQPEKLLGLT